MRIRTQSVQRVGASLSRFGQMPGDAMQLVCHLAGRVRQTLLIVPFTESILSLLRYGEQILPRQFVDDTRADNVRLAERRQGSVQLLLVNVHGGQQLDPFLLIRLGFGDGRQMLYGEFQHCYLGSALRIELVQHLQRPIALLYVLYGKEIIY